MLLTLNHLAPFHSPHQDLAALLAIEVGRRAALLVDEAGRIVAATPAACDLLRQSEEQLLGQHFGMWASSAEEVELDLIIPGGHRHSVLAQAHSRSQPGLVTILIERREPRAFEVEEVLRRAGEAVAQRLAVELKLPDTRPHSELPTSPESNRLEEILEGILGFLVHTCGARAAEVAIHRDDLGWLAVHVIPIASTEDDGVGESTFPPVASMEPFEWLCERGGDFRISLESEKLSAFLNLPQGIIH